MHAKIKYSPYYDTRMILNYATNKSPNYRIKEQNSKMYYITFTEPYKFFRRGFLEGFFSFFTFYSGGVLLIA